LLRQTSAIFEWQGCSLLQTVNLLAIYGIK
jgi:hypothetical protein